MFRNALLVSLFVVGSSSLLHGGGGMSHPTKNETPTSEKNKDNVNEYEIYQTEMSDYLEKLELKNINTRKELMTYLETKLDKDLCNANIFPLFIAIGNELQSSMNSEQKTDEACTAIQETVVKFISTKIASLKLAADEDENKYEEINNE